MTKAEVIAKISKHTGLSNPDSSLAVEAFLQIIKSSMCEGENVYIRGFGSFINKKRKQKLARNISKNITIVVPEHFVPTFKPSKIFLEKIRDSKNTK